MGLEQGFKAMKPQDAERNPIIAIIIKIKEARPCCPRAPRMICLLISCWLLFLAPILGYGLYRLIKNELSTQALDRLFHPEHFGAVLPEPADSGHEPWFAKQTVRMMSPCYNCDVQAFRARVQHLLGKTADWRVYLASGDSTSNRTLLESAAWAAAEPHRVHLVPAVPKVPVPPDASFGVKHLQRIDRLTRIRNSILEALVSAEPDLTESALVIVYDGDHWGPMSRNHMIESMVTLQNFQSHLFAVSACGRKSALPGLLYVPYDAFAYRAASPDAVRPSGLPRHFKLTNSSFSGSAVYILRDYKAVRYPGSMVGACEHAMLHEELQKLTGRIMAQNKRWRLHVGGDHSIVVASKRRLLGLL